MRVHEAAGGRQQGTSLELPLLACLLGFLMLASFQSDVIEPAFANVTAGISVIAIMGLGCRALLRSEPMAIWSPLFWFRVAYAAYYGLGALVPYVANDATLVAMQSLYRFSDEDVLKMNLINVVALICILIGTRIVALHLRARDGAPPPSTPTDTLQLFMLIFLLAGGFTRYAILLPVAFGFSEGIVPSIVGIMGRAYSAGLMLLIIVALRRGRFLLMIAAVLVLIELAVGVLSFNKSDVLITILCVLLAFYHHRPSLVRLGVGAGIAIAVFVILAPLVGYGRDRTIELGGGRQVATLEDRLNIVSSYLEGDAEKRLGESEVQGALARFSYVNAATMVIAWHDVGRPGTSLEHALTALVPRLLWPDKPSMTEVGGDLYTAATGNIGTSISAGLPAEAYWNLGWWGILLLMPSFGVVLALLAHAATSIMAQERWLFLPVVLMGVQVGTRVDGHYVPDIIGGPFTIAIMYFLLRGVEIVLFTRTGRS
jgi:hypothetical protein